MRINITNQLPTRLEPSRRGFSGALDPLDSLKTHVVGPLTAPIPGLTTTMADDAGAPVTDDDVLALVRRCLTGVVDDEAEDAMRDFLRQTLVSFNPAANLRFDDVFVNQAASAAKLPLGPLIMYTADSDVIPAAKTLLASPTAQLARDTFFVSLAQTYHPPVCGAWFASEPAYRRFAEFLDAQTQSMAPALDADVVAKLGQVRDLPMDGLTESLLLRVNESDDNDPLSFSRLLVCFLDDYAAANPQDIGGLPFLLSEHLLPMSLVLVNVERTARATARDLSKEWSIIDKAVRAPVKVLKPDSISKLDVFARAHAAAQLAASRLTNTGAQNVKARPAKLRRTRPTNAEIIADVVRLLKRFRKVAVSHNIVHAPAVTFSKANRRSPMDFNLPGKTRREEHKPDIHVYIDTSGSIGEPNYRSAVMMMIKLAKKLDVDLYLSSFSHVLSAETLVVTRNRSPQRIWNVVQRIPKVSGGTDFEQIWRHVNMSTVRKRRLSVIVTDFEFTCSTSHTRHPKNLVYAPCSNMNWDRIRRNAEKYADSASHIDSRMAGRFLGMSERGPNQTVATS